MKKNKYGMKYRFLSCVMLCVMLFSACGQETELAQEDAAAQPETTEENEEAEEAAVSVSGDTVTMPDLSGAKNAEEALALLIEDEGFRERVRYESGIAEEDSPEVILQKLESCESVVLREVTYGIYSLESLELLPNLKRLVIDIEFWDDSDITDFSPIAQLSQLEKLYISYGKAGQIELSFLGEMPTITELYLVQSQIEDLSFLEKMPQLQRLSLYETQIEDLAVLEKLPELIELSLQGNENAQNIEAVGTLTKMQDLGLQECGIEDISFLSGLTELRAVNLNGNIITDITPLAGLDKLERLGLSENEISDISALKNLEQLYDLALDGNKIRDISALAQLSRLNQVGLSDNMIEDLSPLAGKEELMYAAVFGNPIKNIEPVWDVPLLWCTERNVSDEEESFVADYLAEHYPEAEEFGCDDFIQGDLNNDGLLDTAFVVCSDAFDDGIYTDRRMFILLQQSDGSWAELEGTPRISHAQSGGMRGDPYKGALMTEGYLIIRNGWGSRDGTEESTIYEYQNGGLNLVKQISVGDDNFSDGYDVVDWDMRDDTWQNYVIAMDGYRMVRVDLSDSENPEFKAFPEVDLYDMSYYINDDLVESQITSSEALDRVLEEAVEDPDSAVLEDLPYAEWQKEGYELLLGVALPDYFYAFPETKREADGENEEWDGDYLYYDGLIWEDERLYHKIRLVTGEVSEWGVRETTEFLLDDATGEIRED